MRSELHCYIDPTNASGCRDDAVCVNGDLRISFRRTIRVPDNENNSHLPPDLGPFPLEQVSQYSTALPDDVVVKGGLFFPMHQREAMWIKFTSLRRYLIKIYVGGVNAISGASADETVDTRLQRLTLGADNNGGRRAMLQDYVVVPEQRWLDGIARGDGTVQQFIAMPTGSGYSVETQIEITPEKEDTTRVVLVRMLTGRMLGVPIRSDGTIDQLKEQIEDQTGIPDDMQRLIYAGRQLDDYETLNKYGIQSNSVLHLGLRLRGGGCVSPQPPAAESVQAAEVVNAEQPRIRKPSTMGIAAGGKIKQVIHADRMPKDCWDPFRTTVFNVNIVDSGVYQRITGNKPPETPIDAALYAEYGYPFFELLEPNSGIHGEFAAVRSVAQIDKVKEEHVVPRKVTLRARRGPDGKWMRRDVPVQAPPDITNPAGPLAEFRTVHDIEQEIQALKMEDMMDTK